MKVVSAFRSLGKSLYAVFPSIRYMASTCWIGWVLLVYSGEYFAGEPNVHGYDTVCYVVSTATISVTFFLFGISKERGYRAIRNDKIVLAASLLASIGTVAVLAASLESGGLLALTLLGNVLTGLGTGCLAMKLAVQLSEESPKNAFILASSSLVASLLLYSAVLTFPVVVGTCTVVCLPVVAMLFSLIDYGSDVTARIEGEVSLPPSFIRFIAAIFVLALALSVTRGFYPNGLRVDEFNLSRGFVVVALIVCCLAVAGIAAIVPKGFSFGAMGYWAIIASVFAFSIAPVAGFGSFVTGVTFSVVNGLLGMIAWALFASLSSRSGISPLRVYGLGFSAFMLGSTVGWPVGYVVDALHLSEMLGFFSAGMLVVAVFVSFVLFPHSNLATISNAIAVDDDPEGIGFPGEADAGDVRGNDDPDARPSGEESARPRWRIRVMSLAEEHELSVREAEVFTLMAKGKNARVIADELCVSYNTARTHVRNIYTKTNVHSRSEFDRLIEGHLDPLDESPKPRR